ncbi:MAG: hypothetical protein ACLFUJ_02820 [Phycisphaerae bacterium]
MAKPAKFNGSEYLAAFRTTRRFKNLFLLVLVLCLLAQLTAYVLVVHVGVVDAIHSIEPPSQEAQAAASGYETVFMLLLPWTQFVGFVSGILLTLTISFTARISLVDRLGGVAGFVRAMFWTLLAAAMVTPWQTLLELPYAWGALTDYIELLTATADIRPAWGGLASKTELYITTARLVAYPALALVALVVAQISFMQGYRRLGTAEAAGSGGAKV